MDYQGIKVIEPVGFFRGVAREALRGRWGLAFGAGFLYSVLVTLPVTIFDSLFGNKMDAASMAGMLGAGADAASIEALYDDFYIETTSIISGLYSLLTTGAFTLGITILVIHILRRAEAGPSMIFSGFGNYFKSLGVMVLIGLISIAVIIVFMIPMFLLLTVDNLGLIALIFPLFIGMFVVLLIVSLIFGLSYYILADNPGMGVVKCLSLSRQMMRGNKGKLFILYLSFIGWAALYVLYASIVGGISMVFGGGLVSSIIATLLVSVGSGVLSIYVLTSEAAFYEKASGISSGMFNLSKEIPNENPGQSPDQNNFLDGNNDDNDKNE